MWLTNNLTFTFLAVPMAKTNLLKPFPLIVHVIFWIAYFLWIGVVNVIRHGSGHIWIMLAIIPVMLGISYLNWYGLRRFFLRGGRWKDVAFSALYLLALLFVGYQILYGFPNQFAQRILKDQDMLTFHFTMYFIEVISFYWTFAYKGLGMAAIEILFNLARSRIAYLRSRRKDIAEQRKKVRMRRWISHFLGNMATSLVSAVKKGNATARMLESFAIIWAFGVRMMVRETKFSIPLDTELYHLKCLAVIYPISALEMKIEGDTQQVNVIPMILLDIYKNMYKHGDFEDGSEAVLNVSCHSDRLIITNKNKVAARSRWIYERGGTGLVQLRDILQEHYDVGAKMVHQQRGDIFYLQIEILLNYGRV